MSESNSRLVAMARERFLTKLKLGPTTFTDAISGLALPEDTDGRMFGAMVAGLHRDRIIERVTYVPSSNRCCHSCLWRLVDLSKGAKQ